MKKIIANITIDKETTQIFGVEENGKVIIFDYADINNIKEFNEIKSLEDIKDLQNEIINKDNMTLEQHLGEGVKKGNDYDGYENRKIISMKESK